MKQLSKRPTRKVQAVGIAGVSVSALATVVVWFLKQYYNVDVPLEVAIPVVTIMVTVLTFASGYMVRPSPLDTIVADIEQGED